MQKSLKLLEDIVVQNESARFSHKTIQEPDNYFNQLLIHEPIDYSLEASPQVGEIPENSGKLMTKISYDVGEEID